MTKRRKRARIVYVRWVDTEKYAGWDDTVEEPPVAITRGYFVSGPRRGQKIKSYKIADTCIEGAWGGIQIIPVGMVREIRKEGWDEVPYRRNIDE